MVYIIYIYIYIYILYPNFGTVVATSEMTQMQSRI